LTCKSNPGDIGVNIVLSVLIALVMIAGGAAHLAAPDNFYPLVPAFLPATPVILVTGVVQIAIGLAALAPRTRSLAGLTFAALCATYLPLHLWDFVRPDPVFAPPIAASIRVAVQLVFIAAGYALWNRTRALPTTQAI
jgi:uncharacterized membrane protein